MILVTFFCFFLSAQWAFSIGISQEKAASIAQNFLNSQQSFHTIASVKTFTYEGQKAGYLMELDPSGYILIASDTIRVPVKAYSMRSDFDCLPQTYVKALGRELLVPRLLAAPNNDGPSKAKHQNSTDSVNQKYWDFLRKKIPPPSRKLYGYVPNSHLLTTKWNQHYPYNKFLPEYGDGQAVTGCVQTAVAQVMKYHAWPSKGSGVFTHTWNGQTFTASMNRPFHWGILPDVVGGASPGHVQEETAALMLDLGILNEAEFGTQETSAYLHGPLDMHPSGKWIYPILTILPPSKMKLTMIGLYY
ncbi:MAG: hypothetical protein CSB28_00480 [Desulfobacterales bacterium]|nr:MAG: hypothetical protein CSB28_00480 [Desulfobacterales bacterium]